MTEEEIKQGIDVYRQRILKQIAGQPIGRDHVDMGLVDGLAAGMFFAEKMREAEMPEAAENFNIENRRIAKVLGVDISTLSTHLGK